MRMAISVTMKMAMGRSTRGRSSWPSESRGLTSGPLSPWLNSKELLGGRESASLDELGLGLRAEESGASFVYGMTGDSVETRAPKLFGLLSSYERRTLVETRIAPSENGAIISHTNEVEKGYTIRR